MPSQMIIKCESITLEASLEDTPTALAIADALPLTGFANRWGDEIYFTVPVDLPLEPGSRELLELGELGYWPTGNAFCLFFGPTPLSQGNEIRAASAVNVFGKIQGDPEPLKTVQTGAIIQLSLKTS
jgi:uncharacterized protein